jgi:serine/threonine protein phosphatase 1
MPKIAAIGDIHGELGKLDRLLAKLLPELQPHDTILFIGDYIDRGPDTKGVIDRVLELRQTNNVITLRGNHEQMMLDAYSYFRPRPGDKEFHYDFALNWFANGAHQTLASYEKADNWWQRIPDEHWAFLKSTAMEYAKGHYLFVHAGVLPAGEKWEEPDFEPKIWVREPFIASLQDFGDIVVFGHTPLKNGLPLFMRNKIGIDTGAAYGGPLTAIILDPAEPYKPENVQVIQSD